MDEGERGDDEDDAGRCRSDARAQPSTAFVAAERVGGTVDSDGADITREREKKFRERPLLSLPEMEAATSCPRRAAVKRQVCPREAVEALEGELWLAQDERVE